MVNDPLAAWRACSDDERAAVRATLHAFSGTDPEVIAAAREGDELIVHAIYDFEVDVPQQVGADLVEHNVVIVVAIGSQVTSKWSSSTSYDEREDRIRAAAIQSLRERALLALAGPALSEAEAELIAAIEATEADGPRMVYADWLQERNDPRGQFMALQRANKATPEQVAEHLRSIPFAIAEHTIFDRGLVDVLGVATHHDFRQWLDFYARMRPLPSQFVCRGQAGELRACISADRRRFATADTFLREHKKRTWGTWKIVVGRCADRSELYAMELEWVLYGVKRSQLIERISFTRDGALQIEFSTGEPPRIVELP